MSPTESLTAVVTDIRKIEMRRYQTLRRRTRIESRVVRHLRQWLRLLRSWRTLALSQTATNPRAWGLGSNRSNRLWSRAQLENQGGRFGRRWGSDLLPTLPVLHSRETQICARTNEVTGWAPLWMTLPIYGAAIRNICTSTPERICIRFSVGGIALTGYWMR